MTTRIHESSFLAGRFAPSVRRRAMATSEPNGKNLSLTPLEKQIMALVLAGYTSKESGERELVLLRPASGTTLGVLWASWELRIDWS